MNITPYELAQRFIGVKEVKGQTDNPFILSMLQLDSNWASHDEVPWCSAFVNYICWLLRLPRSKRLDAKSWLEVGVPVPIEHAGPAWDVVILQRGTDGASGHVAFFSALGKDNGVYLLGGNQDNSVKVGLYDRSKVLGVRRLIT